MPLEVESLAGQMIQAGRTMTGDIWEKMSTFAIPELRKIATQIVAIAENADAFTPAGAKALLDMQVKASLGIIAGMTELTLLAVQTAINAILDAVRGVVNGAIGFGLL